MKKKILKLKKELGAVILAHNYQIPEIQDIADFLGDSLELARISKDLKQEIIVFCGVKFMAETVKILSPQKKVLLSAPDAGCPLADMISPGQLIELKRKHPHAWTVTYVNTSAEIKALSDVCCASANAVEVVKNLPANEIIFIPDKNLGWWVKTNVPQKKIIIWPGFCYVHQLFRLSDLDEAKRVHPDAEILVHPECRPQILKRTEHVFSTSGMLKRAKEFSSKKFIIGTEEGLIYRLKKENPDKDFYSLGSARICSDMKKTTLKELYQTLKTQQYEVTLPKSIIDKAKKTLKEMVRYI